MKKRTLQFEDLNNELIYEIFDYLDYFHIYKSVFSFNSRFRSNFPLPININLLMLAHKTSLRTLILENIQSKHLTNVIHQLQLLSNLSSLTIATLDLDG
ncbi:hypothetical protein I4U23_016652 [Adineta vaga]|nr:hypothetical protein I4U23_016652 [Adineta vaga]